MKAHIDKFGRLVIPRPLRDRFQLKAGSVVEVQEDYDHLTITPIQSSPVVTREKSGMLVLHAELPENIDPIALVREERDRRILGI